LLNSTPNKSRFFISITLLLLLGFFAISLVSYFTANDSVTQHIRKNTLPLTSDNIYSEIQRDLLPTVMISSLMAQDTFARDWIIAGEKTPDAIIHYLKSIQAKYNTETAFFVSEKTRHYYHSSGILKSVNEADPQDSWYFRVRQLQKDFEINIDTDTAVKNQTNIFVNHQVKGYNGELLGAIGVGLSSDKVFELIQFYQTRYNRQVYFAQKDGAIILSGNDYLGAQSVYQTPGLTEIASDILNKEKGSYVYQRGDQEVLLETRFVPELDWYLLVEQIGKPEAATQETFWLSLLLSLLISSIVLGLTYITINKYQQHLVAMATTDQLTQTNNRHGFDVIFQQVIKTINRNKEPLSIMLIDIDLFKKINDQHGHMVGDKILIEFTAFLERKKRKSDLLSRWGGEEFLLALPQCDLSCAKALADKLCAELAAETFNVGGESFNITASFGIAEYITGEAADTLISRADSGLYQAKTSGRNRVAHI